MKARIFITAAMSVLLAGTVAAQPLKAKPDKEVLEQLNGSRPASESGHTGAVSGSGEDPPSIGGNAFNSKPRLGKDGYVIRGPYRDSGRGSFPSSQACVFLLGERLPPTAHHAVSQCMVDLQHDVPHISKLDLCRRCWP